MRKYFPLLLQVMSTMLGLFFLYKGINKHFLSPCKVFGPDSNIPIDYQQVMNAFCVSGFAKVVGAMEVVAGLLLLVPRWRTLGAMVLFPIITNIFLIHFFLDNRPEELVETGLPLLATVVLLLAGYNRWKRLWLG